MSHVSEWWALFFVLYKIAIGFAVVQVITTVFIQQTFKIAARDEDIMIAEKKSQATAFFKNLEKLFEVLDESGDGMISLPEFESVVNDPRVRTWFDAIDVDARLATKLFAMLDDGDGHISIQEFSDGIKSIKG